MAEPETLQARAHVEGQHDVQGNLLEAGEIDRLPHAVVQHFEIARHQALDWLAVCGDEHVHADRFDSARKGLRRREGDRQRERAGQRQSRS